MKTHLASFLLLFPFCSDALSYKSATPMLHSVLDKAAPAAAPMQVPADHKRFPMKRDALRREGRGLTIAGVGSIALGGAFLGAQAFKGYPQDRSDDGSGDFLLLGLAIFFAFAGALLIAIGLPIWLTHLGTGKPG